MWPRPFLTHFGTISPMNSDLYLIKGLWEYRHWPDDIQNLTSGNVRLLLSTPILVRSTWDSNYLISWGCYCLAYIPSLAAVNLPAAWSAYLGCAAWAEQTSPDVKIVSLGSTLPRVVLIRKERVIILHNSRMIVYEIVFCSPYWAIL